MTKAEVIEQIMKQTGLDRVQVNNTLEAFFGVVQNNLKEGDSAIFRGFGTFSLKKRAEKMARNIHTKEPILVEAHYIPEFKPAKTFLENVRNSDINKAKIIAETAMDKTKKQSKSTK